MRSEPDRLKKYLSIGEVCFQTTLGKSCIYDKISQGDFPRPRQLTRGRVAWLQSDVEAWIDSRPVVEADVAA